MDESPDCWHVRHGKSAHGRRMMFSLPNSNPRSKWNIGAADSFTIRWYKTGFTSVRNGSALAVHFFLPKQTQVILDCPWLEWCNISIYLSWCRSTHYSNTPAIRPTPWHHSGYGMCCNLRLHVRVANSVRHFVCAASPHPPTPNDDFPYLNYPPATIKMSRKTMNVATCYQKTNRFRSNDSIQCSLMFDESKHLALIRG
jgi:hypothetical protein